jgi:hypothetical protein
MISPNHEWSYDGRAEELGNLLADYVDAGGGLVMTTFSWQYPDQNGLHGRLLNEGYSPFTGGHSLYSDASLGSSISHPIMNGVSAVAGYYRDAVEASYDAQIIATWSDGVPFVAIDAGSGVVAVNLFPEDSYGYMSGDYVRLYVNALNWAAKNKIRNYELLITLDPQNGGIVTSSPPGLTCSGNTCQGSFQAGTSVTLTASPNSGWAFAYWDDENSCYLQNSYAILMDGDKTVTAKFSLASRKAGAVIFIDGIQIIQVLFDPLSLWPGNYSQYLVDAIDDNSRKMFGDKKIAITPFVWANVMYDTGAVSRLSRLLESWTNATNATGGPLIVVSHSWGTVLSYLAISANSRIHIDKLITLGSPLEANLAVSMYSNEWLNAFGLLSLPKALNVDKWHNYWAKCDPISARIHIADKNYQIQTKYRDFESAYQTCHAAYFKDPAIWSQILLNAYQYNK